MATAVRINNGSFSDANWTGGSGVGGVPADGDNVTFTAGYNCLMDTDLSLWTGLGTVTIQGHATTPAMLYFKDGTNGYLKIRTGYNIVGTSGACKGRLLANSDGVWRGVYGSLITASASTNKISATAHGLANNQAICFNEPYGSTLPAPLVMGYTYYIVNKGDNDFEVSLTSGGAAIDLTTDGTGSFYFNTVLAYANKAVILCEGTSKVDCQYLDNSFNCYEPTTKYIRTYGTAYQFTAGAGTVDIANDTIDLGTTPPAAGTAVRLTVTSTSLSVSGGVLPGGLTEDAVYYIRGVSGTKCKLALQNADAQIVDITSVGSGTVILFTGHTSTSTDTINVLEDVRAVTGWETTAGHNRVGLTNASSPTAYDQQRLTLVAINAGTIQLSANVDSSQYPGGLIVLASRNVSARTSCTTDVYLFDYINNSSGYGCFNNEFWSSAGTGTTFYGRCIYTGNGHVVNGALMGFSYGISEASSNGFTFNGVIVCCSSPFNSGVGIKIGGLITGCLQVGSASALVTYAGIVCGCTYAFSGYSITAQGTIYGCQYGGSSSDSFENLGLIYGLGTVLSTSNNGYLGGTIYGCTSVLYTVSNIKISGSITHCGTFSYYSQFDAYNFITSGHTTSVSVLLRRRILCRSFKHGGVANDTRGWSSGGTMTHETTEVPSGKSYSHKFTYTSASFPNYFEWELSSPINSTISISVYAKHDATGLTEAQRLHWQIIDPTNDPMVDATKSALDEFIAADSTDWQTHTLTYNKTDDKPLILRVTATRGSGNAYCLADENSGGDFPDAANVLESDTTNGVAGTYHEAQTSEVKDGILYGASSGMTGTYSPGGTYADGQAAQLSTDQAAVNAAKASIKDDTTILTIVGTYDFTSAIAAGYSSGYSSGQAAQLSSDQAAVLAKVAYIDDTQTILGQAGTLDMDLYLLKSVLPDKKYLYYNIDRGDGQKGTLRASKLHTDAGAPGVDLIAAILKKDSIVDDVTGTLETITDLPALSSVLDTDTLDGVAGTFHAPTVAEVQAGVTFGVGLTGTYGAASISLTGVALIRAMLESKLNVLTPALATAWENAPYTPIVGTAYQRVYLLVATPDNPTVGSGFHRERGLFHINLLYPLQAGTAAASTRAESIKSFFKRGTSITSGDVTVIIDSTPEISQGFRDGDRWNIPIKIRWHADIFEQ